MMISLVTPLRIHPVALAAVSGVVFLGLSLGARALPRSHVATAEIKVAQEDGRLLADGGGLPEGVTALRGDTPGRWRLEARGATGAEARHNLDAGLERLRSLIFARLERGEEVGALASRLQEKARLLEARLPLKEPTLRKIEALGAAAFALEAGRDARRAGPSALADPVSSLLASLKSVRETLSENLSPDHPRLASLSREIEHLEAAAASRAAMAETSRRIALFKAQLKRLQERYAPDHPDVMQKAAELRALERRWREGEDDYALIAASLQQAELARRENRSREAEAQALSNEKQRLQAEVGQTLALEKEVSALAAEVAQARLATRQSLEACQVVSAPNVRATGVSTAWVGPALGFALGVGVGVAFFLHDRGRKVWGVTDLPPEQGHETVFVAPRFTTPGAWKMSLLRVTAAALPWVAAVSVVSSQG